MCSSINVSRFSQWSVKKLHKNCLFYICMDGESQNFIRRTWIWIRTNQWKMTQLLSKTNLGNFWKMVQKLEISFKAVTGWFRDFHSFYFFIISTWKQIFRGLVLQKYLTHFASDYRFCKISWTLYGHLRVLFVRLGICACGTSFPIHCSRNQPKPNNW